MTATVGTNSPMTPVPGPVPGTIMTPGYARAVAQLAYAWGWPMVNIQSRRLMYAQVPMKGTLGPVPVAPLNELALLADALTQLDRVLDRSHLMPPGVVESLLEGMKAGDDL